MTTVRWTPVLDLGIAPIVDGWRFRRAIDRFHRFGEVPAASPGRYREPASPAPTPLLRPWPAGRPRVTPEPANDFVVDAEPRTGRRKRARLRVPRRSGLFAGGAALLLATAACSYPYFAPAGITAPYLRHHGTTQAIELIDSRSRWLGVMPQARSGTPAGGSEFPAYATMDTVVPKGWLDVLIVLEDRNIRSWRSVHGIDLLSSGRAVIGLADGTDGRGGSTLVMQLVRSMRGVNPSNESFLEKLRRKTVEWKDGAALYRRLGGIDEPAFQQYLARHFVLVQGARRSRMGTPLHGLGMAGQVLWGVPPEELDLAQQAILAAAVWRPIVLAPDDDPRGIAERDERWRMVVRRAILGLQLAYPGDPRAQAAIERLRRMPPPRPSLAGIEASRLTSTQRFRLAANPERRAATIAQPELVAARGELLNRLGREGASNVTGIRLTVDLHSNRRFRIQVRSELRRIERLLGGRLSTPLLDGRQQAAGADVMIAVMHQGRVVRFYSNSEDPIFNGALSERDGDGRFAPDRTGRQTGSVAKAMLAVLFGRADHANTLYCNQRLPNGSIHNATGDAGLSCDQPRAWHSARSVFGKSMILPLIWRGRSIPDRQMRDMAVRFRLSLPQDVPAHIALPTGLATARPSDLAGMMQAIGRGAMGRAALASQPSTIAALKTRDNRDWRSPDRNLADFDLRQDFSPRVAQFVRAVLSAPVQRGGTLAGLNRTVPNADLHIAKSGTTTTASNLRPRDKYAVGAFHTPSGDWSYIVMISARDAKLGLGDDVPWSAFFPLLRSTVSQVESDAD